MPANIQCAECNKKATEGRDIFSCGHPICLDCYIRHIMLRDALFARCNTPGCKAKESTYTTLKNTATPSAQKTVRQIDFKTAGRLLFGMTNSAQICGKFLQLGYEFTQKMLEPRRIFPWVNKLDKGVMMVSLIFLGVFGLIFGRYYVEDNREFCLHVWNNIGPDFGDVKRIPPKRACLLLLISIVCALIGISNLNYAFHLPAMKYVLPSFIRYLCLFPFAMYSIGLFCFSIGHLGTIMMSQQGRGLGVLGGLASLASLGNLGNYVGLGRIRMPGNPQQKGRGDARNHDQRQKQRPPPMRDEDSDEGSPQRSPLKGKRS